MSSASWHQMFRSRCAACGWVSDVCALPMRMDRAAEIMRWCHCHMCGNLEGNTPAPSRSLTDDEIAHMRAMAACPPVRP